jgi:hypothetical protein
VGAIFYDGLLLTPSVTNFLLAVVLYSLAAHLDGGRMRPLVLGGICLGLAIVLRANTMLLCPGLALLILLRRTARTWRARAMAASVLLAAASIAPAPVILYNGLAHGEWAPVSANGGMNFWVGNNAQAEGVYHAADFLGSQTAAGEHLAFLAEARRRTGNYGMSLADASDFWLGEGIGDIRADPSRWLRIEGRKAALFLNRHEIKTNVGMEFVKEFSPSLRFDPIDFALLAMLGAGGLLHLLLSGRKAAAGLLAVFIAAPLATSLLFFVSGEYRHPASLPLCVAAAELVRELLMRTISWVRGAGPARSGPFRLAASLLAVAVVTPAAFWRFPALHLEGHPHLDRANYARRIASTKPDGAHASRRNVEQALQLLDRGHSSGDEDVMLLDARLWIETWAAEELHDPAMVRAAFVTAEGLLSRDLRPRPDGYSEYFLSRVRASVSERIRSLFDLDVVRNDPELRREAEILGGDGYVELNRRFANRDLEGARAFLTEALAKAPHHVGLQAAMGRVLLALGKDTEGFEWLRRSCQGWPRTADCAYIAAEHWAAKGDSARAIEAAREALARDAGFTPARELLIKLGERR